MTQAYPLHWPFGWKRTNPGSRKRAKFSKKQTVKATYGDYYQTRTSELTVADSLRRLFTELDRLGATTCIVSTNVETRLDGTPRSDRRAPEDPGVAVYFKLQGKDRVLACDRWDRVADNIAAIAGHIDAIRAQDRYGVGTIDQAFAGYQALPAPNAAPAKRHWKEVLGFGREQNPALPAVEEAFRKKAKECHPDRGGSHDDMAAVTNAIAEARREYA